jgi:CheY-like chemotaxis protein
MSEVFRVLIVDDNGDDIVMLQRAFAKGTPQVPLQVARSGKQALEYLKGAGEFADRTAFPLPRLMILDLKMPGIDGFEIISWVRNESDCRELPIVILSSSNDPTDMGRAHKLGANAYHIKPNDPNALVGMVEGLRAYWVDQEHER